MSLDKILEEYNQNSAAASGTKKINKQVDLTNYFSTYLPKGVNEATKTIRIIPGSDGTPFTPLYIHSHKIGQDWRKLICPNKEKKKADGTPEDCPFCEANKALMSLENPTEAERKLAYSYRPKKTYVIKVIDREKEGEGVKFWRFTHSRQKDGIYDKIISLFKFAKADLSDPESGRDLTITINRNDRGIPTVSSISASFDITPLSTDAGEMRNWLADERTWADVYTVKSYDYLRILVEGGEPVWDKEAKTFVDKNAAQKTESHNDTEELDGELTIGNDTPKTSTNATEASTVAQKPTAQADESSVGGEEEEDDLPF